MKRKITAAKPVTIKSSPAPRTQTRQLSDFVSYMMDQVAQRFRNQVLGGLHKSTINKFADAQAGNYARVYAKLANDVRSKLLKQFDDKRIEELVRDILTKVNERNRAELYSKVEKRIGLSTKELTNTEGLTADINALILETKTWVKKSLDDTLAEYTANSLRAMTQGQSLEEVMQQFDGLVEKRKNHAKFTARNQIHNFNSIVTKIRAQNIGVEEAIWRTSEDERVRPCHQARNGKIFKLSEGLYSSCDGLSLLPGVDYQCRCDYELIIPVDE
jgi:SPP1 gp7 family putative phage head morphogenesis protein